MLTFDGSVEIPTWEGLCHAWAPATLALENPAPVELTNPNGLKVPFGSSDIKALIVLETHKAMMNNTVDSKMSGLRCNIDFADVRSVAYFAQDMDEKIKALTDLTRANIKTILQDTKANLDGLNLYYLKFQIQWMLDKLAYGNLEDANPYTLAQFKDELNRRGEQSLACRDVNAGSFHLVMANLIGKQGKGFIIDMTRDLEVWNQPVVSYQSEILATYQFEDLENLKQELDLPPERQMSPVTHKVVKVRTDMKIVSEISPVFEKSTDNNLISIIYEYYLEIDREGLIVGGTWIDQPYGSGRDRPDFLWTSEVPDLEKMETPIARIYQAAASCARGEAVASDMVTCL